MDHRRQFEPAGSDKVIDMLDWRARRAGTPPADVLDEVDAAARVYDALLAQGHELRFEQRARGARVEAQLRSVEGELVRLVPLAEVLGCGDFDSAA